MGSFSFFKKAGLEESAEYGPIFCSNWGVRNWRRKLSYWTGAERRRVGKFEQCSGGTLFLDEIGDMSAVAQAKVLRAFEYKQFERVGGEETLHTDVRIVAATNRPLDQLLAIRPSVANEELHWSRDGREIRFISARSGAPELWSVTPEHPVPTQLSVGLAGSAPRRSPVSAPSPRSRPATAGSSPAGRIGPAM